MEAGTGLQLALTPSIPVLSLLAADTPIDCPYCEHKLCANCGVAWHAGMTCQQYQARAASCASAAAGHGAPAPADTTRRDDSVPAPAVPLLR